MASRSAMLCLLLIVLDYKGDLTSSTLSNIHPALHAFQSSKRKNKRNRLEPTPDLQWSLHPLRFPPLSGDRNPQGKGAGSLPLSPGGVRGRDLEGAVFFLFSSGHNPAGNDGVDEGFYRRVNSQGKAYRHNIKDKSPAMMKSFFIINEHNPEVYC